MPASSQSAEVRQALVALDRIVATEPYNVPALCDIGRVLYSGGLEDHGRRCYRQCLEVLKMACRAGEADAALDIENRIYDAFVKRVETEEHYYRCFADWRDDMARMGRRLRQPVRPANPNRIAFVFFNGVLLGHTEVFLKLLEGRTANDRQRRDVRVYVLYESNTDFLHRLQQLGITTVHVAQSLPAGAPAGTATRLVTLRALLERDQVGTLVWPSVPTAAAFALSMRLAPVQIYWALRFHPLSAPYIDGYITYGAWSEPERVFGKQHWTVCTVPLAMDPAQSDPTAIAALRAGFPHRLLLGTLAREDKINSVPFLGALVRILRDNPDCGWLWTGRRELPAIREFLESAGVSDRCHFIGWVDTKLYGASLDLFLETWPLGCGVTGYQALAAGVPLLSYLERDTVFGMQYWHEFHGTSPVATRAVCPADVAAYPVTCAVDAEDYVQLAGQLIRNDGLRARAAARGRAYFDEELANAERYSTRFFDTIASIAEIATQKRQPDGNHA